MLLPDVLILQQRVVPKTVDTIPIWKTKQFNCMLYNKLTQYTHRQHPHCLSLILLSTGPELPQIRAVVFLDFSNNDSDNENAW